LSLAEVLIIKTIS